MKTHAICVSLQATPQAGLACKPRYELLTCIIDNTQQAVAVRANRDLGSRLLDSLLVRHIEL